MVSPKISPSEYENFIRENHSFWSAYREKDTDEFLLVETSYNPVINHSNAVVGKMIAQAKGLRIAWLMFELTDKQIMLSYSPNSIFVKFKSFTHWKFILLLKALYYYIVYVLIYNRVLSFSYKGIPYGDFVYDGYLATYLMATFHRFDVRIIKMFYAIMLSDEQSREILSWEKIKAVLVSHYMGMYTGPLSRVAMYMRIPVYWKGGGHEIFNLSVFKSLDQIYDYPKKPSPKEIDMLISEYGDQIEKEFRGFLQESAAASYGVFSVAYNNQLNSDMTRKNFLKERGLEEDKSIVFVMMHAFNDHPHSHFKSMLFRDYYDWFLQTYRFALKDQTKIWIFKQHPADKFYPTKDLDVSKLMRNSPAHIKFVSYDNTINAAVVLNVADAIITCLGTAGVEMPALRAIPVVIAGDTFYDRLGFTIEPKSKQEYFAILQNINPKPLTKEEQLRAQCCYLYLNKYCMMPFSAGPAITFEENSNVHLKALKKSYLARVLTVYKEKKDSIYAQFHDYVQELEKKDFYRLVRLPVNKSGVTPVFTI